MFYYHAILTKFYPHVFVSTSTYNYYNWLILGDKSTDNEEIAVLQEKILHYQDKIQDMIQNNKQLVDENNELLDRVQSSQNYASELKARYVID